MCRSIRVSRGARDAHVPTADCVYRQSRFIGQGPSEFDSKDRADCVFRAIYLVLVVPNTKVSRRRPSSQAKSRLLAIIQQNPPQQPHSTRSVTATALQHQQGSNSNVQNRKEAPALQYETGYWPTGTGKGCIPHSPRKTLAPEFLTENLGPYIRDLLMFVFFLRGLYWYIPGLSRPPTWTPCPSITCGTIQLFLDFFLRLL